MEHEDLGIKLCGRCFTVCRRASIVHCPSSVVPGGLDMCRKCHSVIHPGCCAVDGGAAVGGLIENGGSGDRNFSKATMMRLDVGSVSSMRQHNAHRSRVCGKRLTTSSSWRRRLTLQQLMAYGMGTPSVAPPAAAIRGGGDADRSSTTVDVGHVVGSVLWCCVCRQQAATISCPLCPCSDGSFHGARLCGACSAWLHAAEHKRCHADHIIQLAII